MTLLELFTNCHTQPFNYITYMYKYMLLCVILSHHLQMELKKDLAITRMLNYSQEILTLQLYPKSPW